MKSEIKYDCYDVAGVVLAVDSLLTPLLPNFAPFALPDTDAVDFVFDADGIDYEPLTDSQQSFDYELQNGRCRVEWFGSLTVLHLWLCSHHYRVVVDVERKICQSDLFLDRVCPPRHLLNHALLFAYSLFALPGQRLIIHSSTVVCNDLAVMFLGESGTGKSTHSRLWIENIEECTLLNDDATIVDLSSDTPMACGSPWSGKTACYLNRQFPVKALVRLSQAPSNHIRLLTAMEAFGALLPSTLPPLQQREGTLDMVCCSLSKLLIGVPIYHLHCLPDSHAARLAYDTIFAFLG